MATGDWSSDVCSSDLLVRNPTLAPQLGKTHRHREIGDFFSCLTWRAIPGPLSKLHRSIYPATARAHQGEQGRKCRAFQPLRPAGQRALADNLRALPCKEKNKTKSNLGMQTFFENRNREKTLLIGLSQSVPVTHWHRPHACLQSVTHHHQAPGLLLLPFRH